MKKSLFLIALILTLTTTYSQKKEKIKGSKIVTVELKKVEPFSSLEVADNLEIFLVKGLENSLEIEADDNLHEAINISINGSILRLSTTKDISSFKKLSVRVTYTEEFKAVTTRNNASVSALADLELNEITFKSYDYSKLFLNAKVKSFTLQCDDKSKTELNLKSENTSVSLLKNATLKALINSASLNFNQYQKTEANIEGDVEELKLRLDNNSNFIGKNLVVKNINLITEAYTTAQINVKSNATIEASGKSEIQIFGDQKIDLKRFSDNAILIKKPTK